MAEPRVILKLEHINKTFPGVQALKDVSMEVHQGGIHCLVGENGSGKSTLIRIISGADSPDSGTIAVNGNSYRSLTVPQAMKEGIQVIYQDLSLFPDLTVGENVMFNWLVERSGWMVNRKEYLRQAEEELKRLGVTIDLDERVSNLSMSQRQIVAIARALVLDARLLVFDEPTTALTQKEIDTLLETIMELKERGIASIFVSHKLDEVFRVADVITVLRDGVKIGDFKPQELDERKLSFYMTGREIQYKQFTLQERERPCVLELRNLSREPHFEDVSFCVREGEIVGLIGPLGSGRTELALSLFGLNRPHSGEILYQGKQVVIESPAQAREMGIVLLPEDRHTQGLFRTKPIMENLISSILERLRRFLAIDFLRAQEESQRVFEELHIKAPSLFTVAEALSGGNQQRVVLGKWLATNPKLFILDSPTVGIDVGSKAEIYDIIQNLARSGIAVLLISDEVSEIYHNCNRVVVMREGKVVKILDTRDTSETALRDLVEGRAS
ncbi:MAG: sugar ABC transporter ATP-binding protein [Candidatus Atribacteria bacterium]|nr:sugar ABC transporter ATP-binding protein [Candidatus Atribacteria bacterium]